VCEVINSVFVCGCYKWNLGRIARKRNAVRHVTEHWLVTVTFGIASEVHCGKSIAQASGFWVEQVPTLQATWRVSTPPVASALLITASDRNPSCVRSHEKVSSWSMWPRDQQVHRKRLSGCTSWNTSCCWARQEIPNVVQNTQVAVPFQTTWRTFSVYEGWNFNSGNYLFTTDTK